MLDSKDGVVMGDGYDIRNVVVSKGVPAEIMSEHRV